MGKKINVTGWKMWEHGVPDSRLTVIKEHGKNKYGEYLWECECNCGSGIIVVCRAQDLKSGNTKSCGCLARETARKNFIKHGDSKSRLYVVWKAIIKRTSNPNDSCYKYYGGRGIGVCNEWLNYENFRKWAYESGYKSNAHFGECTIERIDVNKGYEPDNCCWVSMKEQANNKRNNVIVAFNGESHTYSEWDNIMGFPRGTVEGRLNRLKWNVNDALTKKVHNGKYTICEGKIFPTIKKCAEYYEINYPTMKSWLNGCNKMPKEWVEKGLAFYTQDA